MCHYNTEIIASLINAGATLLIGLVVAQISQSYNKNSSRMEHDRLSKELFKEFNERYDKINHSLNKISKECKNLKDLEKNPKLESKLNDFFNLCAEEYYWYKKGRIDKDIWSAWEDGMNDWYNNVDVIREAWEAEIKKRGCKSYYINNKNDFFKKS
ncbi:hypothetical protein [Flavobacterium cyclinae]|uniref:hypothetical protein n=1 Tax=Flavobacterium cyclinae TaxID=2895947 RepID=UPI001E2FFC9A|nr:hypothetical protein [Flavobacterium cyclinae]UGS22238.1 hypothetical protein LOS86_06330 [Flavobacterium cyclinae]